MISKFSKTGAVLAFLAASFGAQASVATTIDAAFTFAWSSVGVGPFTGSLKATDLNMDGVISTGEVTSIYESYSGHTLASLFDIGDINIASQTWIPNGVAWVGTADVAYMTFDNRGWSCNTSNGCKATFTSFLTSGETVPEPASLALFGTALVGLIGATRRRNNKQAAI